ncbi:MAG TPA: phosphoglycerate kinase [Acidimicrobiales bacterium]
MTTVPVLEDLPPLAGKRVLVRADLNVPMTTRADGTRVIEDDFRLVESIPTLSWLVENGATVVVATHLGRPGGVVNPALSVAPLEARLRELVPGVEIMENLRFDPGEEANDPAFVDRIVEGFDYFVNDGFAVSHRAHASVVGPPTRIPSVAGRVLAHEVEVLSGLMADPARPFVAVVGGAKVADKLGVVRALAPKVDCLIVGGGMAFTFLAAQGHAVGASLLDPNSIEACAALLAGPTRIELPSDSVALGPDNVTVASFGLEIADGYAALDIGPESADRFAAIIASAKTVLWNGPMGVFEDPRFANGTEAVARAIANGPGFSVVGGGDSVSAIDHLGLEGQIDYVSTGGGASLEFLENGDLPGLAALRNSPFREALG